MADSLEEWLTKRLVAVGNINAKSDVERNEAMENLAKAIAEAIGRGGSIVIKGSATVSYLNSLEDKSEGELWSVTDSGFLHNDDSDWIEVAAGDVVRYNGSDWEIFLHLDLSSYATVKSLESHTGNTQNPHKVTAAQVGAYTKEDADENFETKADAKAKANAYGILMRENGTNTLQFYRPSLG